MSGVDPLKQRSFDLALGGLRFSMDFKRRSKEFDIGNQICRCATAPGALIAEAKDSESRADMRHKFGIALKECRELRYWLDLLITSGLVIQSEVSEIEESLNEVTAILVASRKTLSTP
ncbi:MAG: four helix bundle protein [Ignavibacteria bacterium]|nr:four helix bundle protein [Ignavibacteria bacterium]MBK6418581.1 four helix bundle protein [Ignavibacteria bacterium]MBK7032503.1 four helix bundle protein [Ignavibacteria bacterium]MBK7411590.1 four helix bundle protein [Ignavibacteria bacterium]MBP7093113.1 four helix bundle protein [Candidatus Kapabacteria bacterium]